MPVNPERYDDGKKSYLAYKRSFTYAVLFWNLVLKFIYSEKATKFCEISTLLLSVVHEDKSKVEIS